jgi:hypothetical protein
MVELLPHYRTAAQIEQTFRMLPWRDVRVETDVSGLQAFVTAVTTRIIVSWFRPANRLRQGYGGPPKLCAEADAGHFVLCD